MATIAVYNMKGGVGKTTMAVNLGWCAAQISARKTLLWDLDPQAAATYIIGAGLKAVDEAGTAFRGEIDPGKLVRKSTVKGLSLLAADASLRKLDRIFFQTSKKKQMKKLIGTMDNAFDHIILDCPPGLTETSAQILCAATVVIVPVIPSALSERAFAQVQQFLNAQSGRHPPLLPVYSMVDHRRVLHKAALARNPDWPTIPMSSSVEKMGFYKKPVLDFEPDSRASIAYRQLWKGIERKLNGRAA